VVFVAGAFLALGEALLWLDLGSRLFGSYARNPTGFAVRSSLLVVLLLVFPLPAVWLWIDPSSRAALISTYVAGFLGAIAAIHFFAPYRWGIERLAAPPKCLLDNLGSAVELSHCVVSSPNLPERADGLTLLVLTDLHCNSTSRLELIQNLARKLQDIPADLVFLLGDFGEKKSLLPEVANALATLKGRHGTYCVLGNHDYESGRESLLLHLLSARGVRVLENQFHDLPELGISILGLARPYRSTGPVAARPDYFVIALSHSPDNLPYLSRVGAALVLSGHTHGGRIRVPGLGPLLVPCLLGRFLDRGWFKKGTTKMYVSRGLGYDAGRFGNVGEISRMVLKKPTDDA
jgi:predicted MPP superfamily phosphohydrolase